MTPLHVASDGLHLADVLLYGGVVLCAAAGVVLFLSGRAARRSADSDGDRSAG